MRTTLLAITLLSMTCAARSDTRLLRFPDISASQVAFVYGNDIYTAARTGGDAKRLTSHAGMELFPKFSPDGMQIAFSAEYSGTRQVYVMPSDGSEAPIQLTWYNDVGPMPPRGGFDYRVLDWTPDGKNILVRMNRLGFDERAGRPYLVPVAGGDEVPLSVPETGGGMLSPDGTQFVYTPIDREFRTWKRTRGGRAQDVWVYDLAHNTSLRLTDDRATDNQPMWLRDTRAEGEKNGPRAEGEKNGPRAEGEKNGTVYFTSDRNYTLNLFAMAPTGGAAKQVTYFKEFDVLWPSAGSDAIVFENGGWLYTYKPGDAEPSKLIINIIGDKPGTLPVIKNVSAQIESGDLSAGGERVFFSARGELFSLPRVNGVVRNLTATPAVRELSIALSPDGKTLAYLSDATGEYELYVRATDPDANVPPTQISRDGKAWRARPVWAPDNQALMLGDSENRLFIYTLDGKQTLVDQATRAHAITEYLFAPDGRGVVYVKANATSMNEIWWFDRASGKKQRVLGGQFDAFAPSFDPAGRYLYFASNREHNLSYSSYEFNYLYDNATRIFAAPLSADTQPLMPQKSDEIGSAAVNDTLEKNAPKAFDVKQTMKLDLPGMAARAEMLAIPGGSYPGIAASMDGVYFIAQTAQGATELRFYDLKTAKTDLVAAGVGSINLSANKSTLLLNINGAWVVAQAKPAADVSKPLDLSALTLRIDPVVEWQQMYVDAWRVLREWFYDPGMHGNDWLAIREKYQPLLRSASQRSDLDYVLSEIAGEVNSGHIYVDRGDEAQVERKNGGLLGAEFIRTDLGYRVTKIFPGQNWSEEFRSPFLDAGVDIRLGDVITAINGTPVLGVRNFYQLLEGQGGRAVEIERRRDGENVGKRVQVKTIVAETSLRYLDWIQTRAELVNKLSNGRIGYVHLPNTAIEGNRELFKQFPSQIDKEALIIDDRYNGGGFIPDRIIEILARKPLNYWKRRGLAPEATPLLSHDGPKAMLINGLSSSGGDALPYYFRKLGLGLLIGTRTWGGLIGLSGNPALSDGGTMSASTFRILSTDNKWVVENEGVAPDIEVLDRPELIAAGGDPSIERAVIELLKTLDATPKTPVVAPPAPTDFGRRTR